MNSSFSSFYSSMEMWISSYFRICDEGRRMVSSCEWKSFFFCFSLLRCFNSTRLENSWANCFKKPSSSLFYLKPNCSLSSSSNSKTMNLLLRLNCFSFCEHRPWSSGGGINFSQFFLVLLGGAKSNLGPPRWTIGLRLIPFLGLGCPSPF